MVCRGNLPPAGKVQGENGSLSGARPTHALEELMVEPAPAKGERSVLPLEEHQRWSLDHYMRTVTVRRSDGPRPCRNNPGWRSFLLSDAAVTMPRHAVIAVSLPVGLNTGSLAQGISVRSCEVPLRRCRIHPAAQERRFLQALIPGREEPPGTPRFRRACRLDPIGVEPRFSLRQHRSTVHSAHPRHVTPAAARLQVVCASLSTNSQEVFITAIRPIVHRNFPARSPHREYGRRLIRGNR